MSFPYSKNPEDWQTAYTRVQAYRDSKKYSDSFSIIVIVPFIIALSYFIFGPMRTIVGVEKISNLRDLLLVSLVAFLILSILFYALLKSIFLIAIDFFTEFHRPPAHVNPIEIIQYRLYGKTKLPPPFSLFAPFNYILVKDGDIEKKDKWPAWAARNIGGPLLLIVFDGCALYLERGNRFSRVVGPGAQVPFLEWYETIKYVVDLRPKVKTGNCSGWTKDGINITLTAQIECRIGDPSKVDPESKLLYPFDPVAVKKAIERYAVRWPADRQEGDPSEFTWVDAAWGQVSGILPGYIRSRTLDDLFVADRGGGQILAPDAVEEIFNGLNGMTNGFGVFITDFQILEIEMPEEVHQHQKENWIAQRQSVATILDGKAKAFSIRTREKARADAQRNLILAIANGLEQNPSGRLTEPVLLSLSRILDESLNDPLLRTHLARGTLDTLERLQTMLDNDS